MSGGTNMARGGGISLLGMLGVLFIGLKLTGFISWSWWWVLAPIWVPAVLGVGIVAVVMLVVFFGSRR